MILLFITGCLFLFITICTGFLFNKIYERSYGYASGTFKALLTGILLLTVYLNVLSIFVKTDFWLLIPPFVLSLFVFFSKGFIPSIRKIVATNVSILFSGTNALVAGAFISLLVLFTIVPPYNTDSGGYHFLAILWNEKFSVVPGLANLFPQYGYNSSFFVLSAAFSFSAIFHQSIYPINFVITIIFFLWVLKKSFGYHDGRRFVFWMLLFIFLRQFPINLASPSADSLASMLVFYILIILSEYGKTEIRNGSIFYLLLLAAFAMIIKLSTAPLMLIGMLPFLFGRDNRRNVFISLLRVIPLMLLIFLPWLLRNVVLSGYLIFPFPAIDWFSFDWKVPLSIVVDEKLHISQGAKMVNANWAYVSQLSIISWFPIWWKALWTDNHLNFLLVNLALISPLLLMFKKQHQQALKIGLLTAFFVAYFGIWFWLLGSPDIRFGYHYLVMCIALPVIPLLKNVRFGFVFMNRIFIAATIFSVVYYGNMAFNFLRPNPLFGCMVKPYKSPEYYKNNDLNTFKFVMINKNIRLYIHDSLHHSINAPLPSCFPYRPGISMRGNKLQDGFKMLP